MSHQAHDIGVQKIKRQRKPQSRDALRLNRLKRRHPGPLGSIFFDLKEWRKAGKPKP